MNDEYEILLEFLDGNLTIEEEQSLFYKLSVNDDLRQKLKDLMSIEQTVSANPSFYAPTLVSTNAIFNKLGFTPPQVTYNTSYVSFFSTFFSYLKKMHVVLPTLGAIILSSILYNTLENNKFTAEAENDELASGSSKREIRFESNVPLTEQYLSDDSKDLNSNREFSETFKNTRKNSPGNANTLVGDTTSPNQFVDKISDFENRIEVSYNQNVIANADIFNSTYYQSDFRISENFTLIENNHPSMVMDRNILSKFYIEVVNNHFVHNDKVAVEPSKNSGIKDLSIALNYIINNTMSVGIFALEETFYQKFDGIDEFGREVIYEQQPLLRSYGVQLLYNVNVSESFAFRPKVLAAHNEGGFVAGLGITTSYNIYGGISFEFGVDLRRLFFWHQNENFGSTKYGINYGITYKFR